MGMSANLIIQCSWEFVIPAPAPDSDPGFAGMTVYTHNRKRRSNEDSFMLEHLKPSKLDISGTVLAYIDG